MPIGMSGYIFTLCSNSPIIGHFSAAELRQSGEHVHAMHDLVAHALRRDLAGPTDQERHANPSLQCGEVLPAPRPGPAIPRFEKFRAVVAGEDNDSVVTDAGPVHSVEHLADVAIHLREHVRPFTVAGFARESGIWKRRQVRLRQRDIGEKGFVALRLPFDELDRAPRELGVDQPALSDVVVFQLAAFLTLDRKSVV